MVPRERCSQGQQKLESPSPGEYWSLCHRYCSSTPCNISSEGKGPEWGKKYFRTFINHFLPARHCSKSYISFILIISARGDSIDIPLYGGEDGGTRMVCPWTHDYKGWGKFKARACVLSHYCISTVHDPALCLSLVLKEQSCTLQMATWARGTQHQRKWLQTERLLWGILIKSCSFLLSYSELGFLKKAYGDSYYYSPALGCDLGINTLDLMQKKKACDIVHSHDANSYSLHRDV